MDYQIIISMAVYLVLTLYINLHLVYFQHEWPTHLVLFDVKILSIGLKNLTLKPEA